MITVTKDQFEELRDLAIEAQTHVCKDKSYQRGVNLLGDYLLKKLNKMYKPKQVCYLCNKDANATSQ